MCLRWSVDGGLVSKTDSFSCLVHVGLQHLEKNTTHNGHPVYQITPRSRDPYSDHAMYKYRYCIYAASAIGPTVLTTRSLLTVKIRKEPNLLPLSSNERANPADSSCARQRLSLLDLESSTAQSLARITRPPRPPRRRKWPQVAGQRLVGSRG